MAGETLGACLAFALARGFLGQRARDYFGKHAKLRIFNEALADEGWKFIALTRMTPFFPFKLSNYLFGALGFRFSDFFWGTLLGTLPLSFVMVYLGSLIPDLSGIDGHSPWDSPYATGFSIGLGVLALGGLFLISRHAGRSYRQKLAAWEREKK
jgi:uncharacterized membrane protein YdjX (TVP38/TMEM64 family)